MRLRPFIPRRHTAAALAGVAALAGAAWLASAESDLSPESGPRAHPSGPVTALAAPSSTGFADLAERVKPAVAFVTAEVPIPAAATRFPMFFERTPLHRFFEESPMEPPFKQRRSTPGGARQRVGSGFFVDGEGHLVTSDHVVSGASEVTVTLHDGTRYPARVVGRDERTDIAVLAVDTDDPVTWIPFGDDGEARVGDWVVAVGNPFGLGGTVTAGILSARGRDLRAGGHGDFLQVDAPINHGNSGGPLFDSRGQVIGVNAAIFAPHGGNVGIGFAVPASIASPVVAALIEDGKVSRAWLGVALQSLTPEIAESLALAELEGGLVVEVAPEGPAARAGIQPGDVVTRVDGRPVKDRKALARTVGAMEPGARAAVTVVRGGEARELEVELAGWPDDAGAGANPDADRREDGPHLGLSLEQRHDRLVVAGVRSGSAAAEAGLRPGDVLLRLNHESLEGAEDMRDILRRAVKGGREHALLLIERRGQPRFVAVRIATA